MAFSITNSVPLITPAYTPINFTLTDPSADYMELDIYIGDASKATYEGDLRTLRLVSTDITVDIEGILQPFFQSDASGQVDLKRFDVRGRSYVGDTSTEIYVDNFYCFNGVPHEEWNQENFIFNASTSTDSRFLNNWKAPVNIHWGDEKIYLYFLLGIFDNSVSSYDVSTCFFRTTIDGVASNGFSVSDTTPQIYELKADPSSLSGLTFSSSTKQYTIDISSNIGTNNKMVFNITDADERFTPKRITWVDSMGCKESFNFDLVKTNNIKVSRTTYNNNGFLRQYNNKCSDQYTIVSNWITEDEALYLKDLWYSPSVMVDGGYIILGLTNQRIYNRHELKLINYEVEYEVANEYRVQNN